MSTSVQQSPEDAVMVDSSENVEELVLNEFGTKGPRDFLNTMDENKNLWPCAFAH